jgi:hypothetical protein
MIRLLCFVLAALASPFKSKLRLEAENAVLRHQLILEGSELRDARPIPGFVDRLVMGVPTATRIPFPLPVPVGNLIRLASEAESRNVSIL